jgi:hypothetical protein
MTTFTYLSNLLVFCFIGYCVVKGIIDILKNGLHGSSDYLPRVQAGLTVAIFFTMVIYWALIAKWDDISSFSFVNIALHLVIPLLAIADYVLIRGNGYLKKRDPLYYAACAIGYFLIMGILGAFKLHAFTTNPLNYWPYGFMNFNTLGGLPVAIIGGVGAVYVGISYLLVYLDKYTKKVLIREDWPTKGEIA